LPDEPELEFEPHAATPDASANAAKTAPTRLDLTLVSSPPLDRCPNRWTTNWSGEYTGLQDAWALPSSRGCDAGVVLEEAFVWRGEQHVRWSRHGSGPAVVFCHGTPWSSALWRRIADALSREFSVYLWDMLGYGTSTMAEGQDVSLAAQSMLLADLLEHWQLTDPHVVAHDYGGAVSLRAHLLHGARYRSLALVDVVALAPWGSEFFRLVAENASTFARLPPPLHAALVRAYIAGAAHHPLAADQLDMLCSPWLAGAGQAAFYRQIAQSDQRYTDEIEPLYPTLDMPVLVAWGVEDAWIHVDRAHRLAELIPGAELCLVPGAGHLIQLDAPEELTAILQRWLLAQPHP
jgi:pimeloyl-ACP methyl ester carboxylesterase